MRVLPLTLLVLASCGDPDLEARVAALEDDLAAAQADNDALVARLEAAEAAAADNASEIEAINGAVDLTALAGTVDGLTATTEELDGRLAELEDAGLATESWVTEGFASQAALGEVRADVATNGVDIASNTRAIDTNTGDIAGHDASIRTNASGIASNTSSISTNALAISANRTSSATNASDIAALDTRLDDAEADISSLQTDLTDLDSDVSTLTGRVSDVESDLVSAQADLTALDGDVSDLSDDVGDLESEVGCPTDMVDAGGYCVDKDENTARSWQAHANLCQSEGKRMCSLAEWMGACNDRSSIGASNMLDGDFEYVDEYWVMHYQISGDYYSSYVSAGNNSCGRVYYSGWACSASSCYDSTAPGSSLVSRCCL